MPETELKRHGFEGTQEEHIDLRCLEGHMQNPSSRISAIRNIRESIISINSKV